MKKNKTRVVIIDLDHSVYARGCVNKPYATKVLRSLGFVVQNKINKLRITFLCIIFVFMSLLLDLKSKLFFSGTPRAKAMGISAKRIKN